MPLEKSAGAVIFRREKEQILFLLLKHQSGHWGFPKGLIEKEETLQEAAKREIKEETGLKNFKFLKDFLVHQKYFFKVKYPYQLKRGWRKGEWVTKIVTYYLVETKNKKVNISFEHDDFAWVSYSTALKKLNFKENKEILQKAYQYIKKHSLA